LLSATTLLFHTTLITLSPAYLPRPSVDVHSLRRVPKRPALAIRQGTKSCRHLRMQAAKTAS